MTCVRREKLIKSTNISMNVTNICRVRAIYLFQLDDIHQSLAYFIHTFCFISIAFFILTPNRLTRYMRTYMIKSRLNDTNSGGATWGPGMAMAFPLFLGNYQNTLWVIMKFTTMPPSLFPETLFSLLSGLARIQHFLPGLIRRSGALHLSVDAHHTLTYLLSVSISLCRSRLHSHKP
jgi:hypothetical protein